VTAARAIPVALWGLAAVLLAVTVWPFLVSAPLGEGDAGAARRQSQPFLAPSAADLALPPLETFSETLSRPLFAATRRPPSPLAALQGQQGVPPPTQEKTGPKGEKLVLGTYLLSGIVVTSDQKIVLLKHATSGKSLRLAEGETLDDWKIATVAPDYVILRRGDREERVSIRERK
jgi:general secretion pathway protein N